MSVSLFSKLARILRQELVEDRITFIHSYIYFFCLRPRNEKSSKTKYINALQKHLVAMTRCQRKTNKVTKVSQHLKIIKVITCLHVQIGYNSVETNNSTHHYAMTYNRYQNNLQLVQNTLRNLQREKQK